MKILSQTFLDRFSIGASSICAIHCAAMPIILALLPTFSFLPVDDHVFHEALVFVIVPISLLAGFLGCRKHKSETVMIGIFTGLGLLVTSALFGHELVGETGEKAITVMATVILAFAHWRNYSLCRDTSCEH